MTKTIRIGFATVCAMALALTPLASHSVGAAAPAATKKFTSCAALLKVYKNGVAATKKAKGKTKAVVNAASYKLNKKLDLDRNGIICDAGDVKSGSAGQASAKFTAKTYEGSGDETIKLAVPAGAVAVATVEFDGEDGITISTLDGDENVIDVPVTSYQPYSGTVLLTRGEDPEAPSDVAMLDVVGDGNWTIKVSPATTAPLFDGDASGDGDVVLRYSGSAIELAATHSGEESFNVAVYDKAGLLVERTIDEYGEIDDVYAMETGAYIVVRATADWTLTEN